jgi:hypothetical protein
MVGTAALPVHSAVRNYRWVVAMVKGGEACMQAMVLAAPTVNHAEAQYSHAAALLLLPSCCCLLAACSLLTG